MENTQESSWENNPVLVQAIESKTAQSTATTQTDIMDEKVETIENSTEKNRKP